MTDEKLIEKAAKAIGAKSWSGFAEGEQFADAYARIAFDVFEHSVARTNDEREAPEAPIHYDSEQAFAWQSGWEAGLRDARRPVQGEPECQEAPVSENVAGQMSVQGELCGISEQLPFEPTDAQVRKD